MACQIPNECLSEILEYLEKDEPTLYSCLLVNRLWCKIAVRILWSNVWDFKSSYQRRPVSKASSILDTLIACLPSESKELLIKNKFYISASDLKPTLFNYVEFCKVLSINEINIIVDNVLRIKKSIKPSDFRNSLVANEVCKMFISQISSLKKFTCNYMSYLHSNNIDISSFPHVNWAKDLAELCCSSNLSSTYDGCNWACIIPTIIEHSHTITKLQLYGDDENLPFTFVSSFTNLKELIFSFECGIYFEEFEKLENVNFSKLEILKIPYKRPKTEYIVNFLRNNGSNLKKFYVGEMNASLNLSIANHCPNIKSFLIRLDKEMAILRVIFNCCPYLESIIIWCGYDLNEKEVLDTIVNYSPNKFHELKMYIRSNICASPEDWESFFISWKYRTPKKLLNLVFLGNSIIDKEYLEIIEKYENLGIIKFYNKRYEEEQLEEGFSHYY
ncbi:hypothetical protein GLOIN_2v1784405 [Rhizophagus irregularis DAOM 181602=DAOM 197198]|uniref:F-box domain-containing protein n=1 Tax=Rhizophagus irregularis (strain DAOM 197198w) TaxID=1432141 RepID=A0A015JU50_RHIIW|nr:hypothetical protein RirG_269020 [Rhizophagus irregularis DAOM 197198w]GBC49121.1 hypothetical protein GLOIN_2v1784405 [Rhizophagus irregularis DAOM 181602=DAOM 197198]